MGLAWATPIQKDLEERHTAAVAHLREHVCPDHAEGDVQTGERFWRELKSGRLPSSISETALLPRPRR